MKIRICSVSNTKYGEKYYIKYKNFLFWHSVYWELADNGQTPYTNWYEPLDFRMYFDTKDAAYQYAAENLFPSKYKVVKEINFD